MIASWTAASGLPQVVAAGENLELVTAILRPGVFVVPGVDRPFLAVGRGLDPARVDAVTDEVLLGGRGPAVTEREVVFVGAPLVAMPADPDPQPRVGLQDAHLLVEHPGVPA